MSGSIRPSVRYDCVQYGGCGCVTVRYRYGTVVLRQHYGTDRVRCDYGLGRFSVSKCFGWGHTADPALLTPDFSVKAHIDGEGAVSVS